MPSLQILHAFAVVIHWFPRLQTICESMAPKLLIGYEISKRSMHPLRSLFPAAHIAFLLGGELVDFDAHRRQLVTGDEFLDGARAGVALSAQLAFICHA